MAEYWDPDPLVQSLSLSPLYILILSTSHRPSAPISCFLDQTALTWSKYVDDLKAPRVSSLSSQYNFRNQLCKCGYSYLIIRKLHLKRVKYAASNRTMVGYSRISASVMCWPNRYGPLPSRALDARISSSRSREANKGYRASSYASCVLAKPTL